MKQTDNIQKYRIKWLSVEITRKCNYKCVHCCKGEPQNVTITPEIIDTMFSQLNRLDHIAIIGGETLLELDMLQYLLESVDKYDLQTKELGIVTNGSILDSRLINILSEFTKKDNTRTASIIISNDQYHNESQSDRAYNFYQSLNHGSQIGITKFNDIGYSADSRLLYAGRAKKYIDTKVSNLLKTKVAIHYPENAIRSHQVCIKNNTIECKLALYANGLIGLQTEADYSTIDSLAFGNVLNDTLKNILLNHNKTCTYLCDECYNEIINTAFGTFINDGNMANREFMKLFWAVYNKRIETVWRIRRLAQQKFPHLPIQEVVSKISIPTQKQWFTWLNEMLLHDIGKSNANKIFYNWYQRKFPETEPETLMKLSRYKYYLKLINDTSKSKKPIFPFGTDDAILSSTLFKELLVLEQEYLTRRKICPPEIDVCSLIPDTFCENEKNSKRI